jgi:hypothetical protein
LEVIILQYISSRDKDIQHSCMLWQASKDWSMTYFRGVHTTDVRASVGGTLSVGKHPSDVGASVGEMLLKGRSNHR